MINIVLSLIALTIVAGAGWYAFHLYEQLQDRIRRDKVALLAAVPVGQYSRDALLWQALATIQPVTISESDVLVVACEVPGHSSPLRVAYDAYGNRLPGTTASWQAVVHHASIALVPAA